MKTAKEIRRWLERQPWYEEFKANVISSHIDDISEIDRILSGRCLLHTITSGFIWSCTDEGDDIWHERHVEFRKWFNS